ncbi:MAG TPA: chemotaxis protein CheW [archaeon]|nr:chemotaxis protein CheW [archaeon]
MLLLLFSLNRNRYALDTSQVIEVVPRINLTEIPRTPQYVAGVFNYHGAVVPVVDLCRLVHKKPCAGSLGTRIILVDYPGGKNTGRILGLIAEGVTETMKASESEIIASGIKVEKAPYLGEILKRDREIIQIVRISGLLPESLQKSLFTDRRE